CAERRAPTKRLLASRILTPPMDAFCQARFAPLKPRICPAVGVADVLSFTADTPPLAIPSGDESVPFPLNVESWVTDFSAGFGSPGALWTTLRIGSRFSPTPAQNPIKTNRPPPTIFQLFIDTAPLAHNCWLVCSELTATAQ